MAVWETILNHIFNIMNILLFLFYVDLGKLCFLSSKPFAIIDKLYPFKTCVYIFGISWKIKILRGFLISQIKAENIIMSSLLKLLKVFLSFHSHLKRMGELTLSSEVSRWSFNKRFIYKSIYPCNFQMLRSPIVFYNYLIS